VSDAEAGVGADRVVRMPPESAGIAPGRGRLVGRRILVVGAGQAEYGLDDPPIGNGRAIALLCAREGARVVCADRDPASAEETVRRILDDGGQASEVVADIADPDAVQAMVLGAHHELGGLDGVVYNVGIGAPQGLDRAPEHWDTVMNVNVRGAMLTARAALPLLAEGSAMVFISSVAGIKPGSRIPVYDASKAALGGLVRHVAVEGERRSIRANIVAPGLMDTALGRMASQGRPSRARTPVPLGRQGTGWETAYAVLFLVSDEAAYVTGQTLVVDGGLSALR
jgi:NAD(P)-dependent dehydrogenase (short-subunit alcohol dehydrogenase family)